MYVNPTKCGVVLDHVKFWKSEQKGCGQDSTPCERDFSQSKSEVDFTVKNCVTTVFGFPQLLDGLQEDEHNVFTSLDYTISCWKHFLLNSSTSVLLSRLSNCTTNGLPQLYQVQTLRVQREFSSKLPWGFSDSLFVVDTDFLHARGVNFHWNVSQIRTNSFRFRWLHDFQLMCKNSV